MNASQPHLQAVADQEAMAVADQEAMDGLPGQAAPVAASVGLPLETAAASTGIPFVSSPTAADDEATAGHAAAPVVYYPRGPQVLPLPPTANNTEGSGGWIARDGVQFAYMMTVTVQINVKDLTACWATAPRVLYEVLMLAAILSLGLGLMTAVMARSSSSRSLYRRVSAFCARLGSILCTILLVVDVSCSGRLGWIAGVLYGALIAGIMAAIWLRGEPVAAAPILPVTISRVATADAPTP